MSKSLIKHGRSLEAGVAWLIVIVALAMAFSGLGPAAGQPAHPPATGPVTRPTSRPATFPAIVPRAFPTTLPTFETRAYMYHRPAALPPLRLPPAGVEVFTPQGTARVVPADATGAEAIPAGPAAPDNTTGPLVKADYREVRVFFGTDRDQSGSPGPRKVFNAGRSLDGGTTFGYCDMTVPRSHVRGQIERPLQFLTMELPEDRSRHITIEDVKILADEAGFYSALKDELTTAAARPGGGDDLFVFIHGYNVTFDDAAYRTAQLMCDLEFNGVPILYSWPSQGVAGEYTYDENNIDWSGPHIREFLRGLAMKSKARRIHILAHSMGNRALAAALENLIADRAHLSVGGRPPFQEIVLAAPDIDLDRLQQLLPIVHPMAARLTLYGSSDDEALRASRSVHGYSRAGEGGDQILVSPDIESIDASGVDLGLLGHSYYGEVVPVLADLAQLLNGAAPSQRHLLDRHRGSLPYWAFTVPGPVGALAGCEWLFLGITGGLTVYLLTALLVLRRQAGPRVLPDVAALQRSLWIAFIALAGLMAMAVLRFLFARRFEDAVGAGVVRITDWVLVAWLIVAAMHVARLQTRALLNCIRPEG